jgi:hypothetical protein
MVLRKVLAFIVVSLMAVPGWAGSAPTIGTVQGSNDAIMHGTSLVLGTTVYSGDEIQVGLHGNAWIALPKGGQVILSQSTMATLQRGSASDPILLVVDRGFAKFRRSVGSPVEGVLADATIRPFDDNGVTYINVIDSSNALIGAEKGSVVVTTPTGATTIPEGMALSVRMTDAQAQSSTMSANSGSSSNNGKAKKILIGALIVAGVTAAALAINAGEPSQNPNVISPYRVQ